MNVRLKNFVTGRVKRCRELMRERGLAGLVVCGPEDVHYLTGFGGEDSVLVLTAARKVLVTDSRYIEQVKQECERLPVFLWKGTMADGVAEVLSDISPLKRKKAPTIGIERDAVILRQYKAFRKAIGKRLKDIEPLVAELRICKDDYEVGQIRKAVRVAEESILNVISWIQTGQSEREVAARLEYEMSRRGSLEPSFPSIVAYGSHAAQPHAVPDSRRLKSRDTILFDWGATIQGYRSDLTRCFVAGRILPVFADAYQMVLEAQQAAIERVKPGVMLKEVDDAARKVLSGSKFPVYGHGTGHGIGLHIHESPAVSGRNGKELREGMVITIEPGIYMPGRFGIRIEDDVLVGSRGPKVLSRLAKDLGSISLQ